MLIVTIRPIPDKIENIIVDNNMNDRSIRIHCPTVVDSVVDFIFHTMRCVNSTNLRDLNHVCLLAYLRMVRHIF